MGTNIKTRSAKKKGSSETRSYKMLFISEARENIGALNNGLVALEKQGGDLGRLNELFRQAHNLKGMAATMGFVDIVTLTHQMEEVLDGVRRGRLKVDRLSVDVLLSACDVLENLVGHLDDAKKISIKKVLKRLEEIKKGSRDTQIVRNKNEHIRMISQGIDPSEILKGLPQGETAYRVTVRLAKSCRLKEPRAVMVVKTLEGMGRVVQAPSVYRELTQGQFDFRFEFYMTTGRSQDAIQKKIQAIPDIEEIRLMRVECTGTGKESLPAPDLEYSKGAPNGMDIQTVRVGLDRLDHIMDVVGELAINKIRLVRIGRSLENKALDEALTQLERLSAELQSEMMQVRLVPMEYVFNRFPRMVRDLSRQEGKEVDLVMEGVDIGLDRTILDEMNEPLVHLLRNAVNHGIELPEERKRLQKPGAATIHLSARRERNFVMIEVTDDGRGMDAADLKKSAIQKGVISQEEAAQMTDENALALVTLPGFSTSTKVTETSGRGVGMNSVREKVESFGGSLKIKSVPNQGSTFNLKLPLSLAIVQSLLIRVASETYAIPLVNVLETIKIDSQTVRHIEQSPVVSYRDTVLPLVDLRDRFGFGSGTHGTYGARQGRLSVVVVEAAHRKAGMVVDELLTQQEVVIKALKESLKSMSGIAGATILGDGKVAMIVDVASVI